MLIANLFTVLFLGFEIFLYYVLGINLFPQQIADTSKPVVDSAPFPTYFAPVTPSTTTTTTAAPVEITCTTAHLGMGVDSCPPCWTGSTSAPIESPSYPNDYNTNSFKALCKYDFEASTGYTLNIVLLSGANFKIETNGGDIFYVVDTTVSANPPFLGSTSSSEVQGSGTLIGPNFPTTEDLPFATTGVKGRVEFINDGVACTSGTCQWKITVSGVAA